MPRQARLDTSRRDKKEELRNGEGPQSCLIERIVPGRESARPGISSIRSSFHSIQIMHGRFSATFAGMYSAIRSLPFYPDHCITYLGPFKVVLLLHVQAHPKLCLQEEEKYLNKRLRGKLVKVNKVFNNKNFLR